MKKHKYITKEVHRVTKLALHFPFLHCVARGYKHYTCCNETSVIKQFPISRSLSTSRRRTDELGYRLERPIHFECKLNKPMHIGMRLLHPAAADHSVSINRQQVQRIFSFSLRSRAVTSFCSWLLLNEWIQRVEHALRKTLVLVVRHYSGGGSSHVEWTAHIRLHYPLFVLQMTISPVCFSMLKEFFP